MNYWIINVWNDIGQLIWTIISDRRMTRDWAERWCYWWRNKYPDNYYLELIEKN